MRRIELILLLASLLAACGTGEQSIPTQPDQNETQATNTPAPTPTPAITATPFPTAEPEATQVVAATPIPEADRDYNLCVNIASDSNGFGHVTMQRPDTGEIAITYITPIRVPLRTHLDAVGLNYLEVRDRSVSAAGVTIESSNYLESGALSDLLKDNCKFTVITPFYPDVAVNLSRPVDYVTNLEFMLRDIARSAPSSRILVLNFYQTDRAEFTADNNGRGLTVERINAFNEALAEACGEGGRYADIGQLECVDLRPFFEDMDSPHVLGTLTLDDFRAAQYQSTQFTAILEDYFEQNPEGTLTGDGIHLSLAGRDRLAERLAQIINEMNREF